MTRRVRCNAPRIGAPNIPTSAMDIVPVGTSTHDTPLSYDLNA